MQTKYAALESKSRVVVAQQSHAVSGATLALCDLSARLTDLVEQLIASYNISEQELEVRWKSICYNTRNDVFKAYCSSLQQKLPRDLLMFLRSIACIID